MHAIITFVSHAIIFFLTISIAKSASLGRTPALEGFLDTRLCEERIRAVGCDADVRRGSVPCCDQHSDFSCT